MALIAASCCCDCPVSTLPALPCPARRLLQMLQALGARIDGPQPAEFNGIKDLEVRLSLDGVLSSFGQHIQLARALQARAPLGRWLRLVCSRSLLYMLRAAAPCNQPQASRPSVACPRPVPLQLWPRVAWSPLWACSWDDVEAKVRQAIPVCDSFTRASQTLPAALLQHICPWLQSRCICRMLPPTA